MVVSLPKSLRPTQSSIHAPARFFEIRDPGGQVRAGFYLDACARPKKRASA